MKANGNAELDVFQMYLEDMAAIVGCDARENCDLVARKLLGSLEAKKRLIEGNLRTVLAMTRNYLNRGVSAGDLVQEANVALVMAVEDADEPDEFEDFLAERVRDALEEAVDRQADEKKAAERMIDRVSLLKSVSEEMAQRLGREATAEELAERMQLTTEEIKDGMRWTLDAMNAGGQAE